jgi:hypothetical protein
VLGRLVARRLHDELKGSAYAIVEGVFPVSRIGRGAGLVEPIMVTGGVGV